MGIRHTIVPSFQIEPNAYARTGDDFHAQSYIFHYTYGIEYTLAGRPQGFNTIGEWSLDKRHYGGAYPPPNLEPPPEGVNPSTRWLWHAWNSAILAAGDTWPQTNAMGTVGWRRESISDSAIAACAPRPHPPPPFARAHALRRPATLGPERPCMRPRVRPRSSKLASAVLGTKWTWAGIRHMEFKPTGVLKTPWGEGKWGLALRPKGLPLCAPPHECLFVDFSGAAHHVSFEMPLRFSSTRVGDGEQVNGTRLKEDLSGPWTGGR